jgi:hypothetical protein
MIEQERRRWMPFKRALSKEDQEAFDRMFACVKHQVQAEVYLSRPWRFEALLVAVLLEQEKRIGQLLQQIEEEKTSGHQPRLL